ncbi:MAG: STAS-like domain-containing protein [Methylacidiphilaceae bacterium]|nr:STAS-like domain-containing protein [Candidatus Methylacidiphilaceae bacterium]
MKELFGSFLADGDLANAFRFNQVEAETGSGALVVFDFEGVTNMTESFANALFGNLAEDHPFDLVDRVRFQNCSPLIRGFLVSSVSHGIERGKRLARAQG